VTRLEAKHGTCATVLHVLAISKELLKEQEVAQNIDRVLIQKESVEKSQSPRTRKGARGYTFNTVPMIKICCLDQLQ
jgi:hypothetical protein